MSGHAPKRKNEAKNFEADWGLSKSSDLAEIHLVSDLYKWDYK